MKMKGYSMLLCKHCIQAIRSRGEELYVGDMEYDIDEAEEEGITCDWCDEYDDLYGVR